MSDIDKQRIAAVEVLTKMGFEWVGSPGQWCDWDGMEHVPIMLAENHVLEGALRLLVDVHTQDDDVTGFQAWAKARLDPYRADHYAQAWSVVRRYLGLACGPDGKVLGGRTES